MSVEPYVFSEVERVRYGRFPLLDTIIYRWARKIEETLFDAFQIELYAGCSVVEEMKFSAFFGSMQSARPIYMVALDPLPGQGLFVLDNRFARLCLNEGSSGEAHLTPENQQKLQGVVQQMMVELDQSCAHVRAIKTRLKKITTHLFRARILNHYEPCLVAQVHLSGAGASARLTWCFPRVMLAPLLEDSGQVIPSLYSQQGASPPADVDRFVDQSVYRLGVKLGSIELKDALAGLRVGNILPLSNDQKGAAVIDINGAPLLVGNIGRLQERYAVKITGAYASHTPLPPKAAPNFEPIQWPFVAKP